MKRALGVVINFCLLLACNAAYAIDSYRYMHVSIETPWRIFLFLLIGILAPFVVLAWLYWRHAQRTKKSDHNNHV